MAFDFKKEYKEFYMPKAKPEIVTVPKMSYIAVRGTGDPNVEGGEYKAAIGLLYGIAFTIKMSKKGNHRIEGYFDYVVPPLEGFWWQDGINGIDYSHKETFNWISVIRLPDFVTEDDFRWAVGEAAEKKKQDFSKVEFLTYDEGLCVQCMHIGCYDNEPATVSMMHEFMEQQGYELDLTDKRLHHEIYLSDARKVAPEKLKTVIRHPIKAGNKEVQVLS
ncbi:MAG: transcriptional regulator [Hungatella sp.]|nr:transcriptional regulator [Hungatella sp.]